MAMADLNVSKINDPNMDPDELAEQIRTIQKHTYYNDMPSPIALVKKTEDGKMEVNVEAIHILSECLQPVTSISIIGKYRTGKSFIMNRIYSQNSGFKLGSAIESQTKGIWMWMRPHPIEKLSKDVMIILLDFEGLYDYDKEDDEDDLRLFCLALLLSKVLIYNFLGAIDANMLRDLEFVSELSKKIKINENDAIEDEKFMMEFPRICFLARDFTLKLEKKGKTLTPNDYLEDALTAQKGTGKKTQRANDTKECIKKYFPQRCCYTLCKPVDDDEKLENLEAVQENEIRPKFMDQSKEVVNDILNSATSLSVGSDISQITGRRFLKLVEHYVNCMNKGAVSCVDSAITLLRKEELRKAYEEASVMYRKYMSEMLSQKSPVTNQEMAEFHTVAQRKAIETFTKYAFLEDRQDKEKEEQLLQIINVVYQDFRKENEDSSSLKCKALITYCFEAKDRGIKSGKFNCIDGYKMYKDALGKAIDAYKQTPDKGPMADHVLQQYINENQKEEIFVLNADKLMEEEKKQRELEIREIRKTEQQKNDQLMREIERRNEMITRFHAEKQLNEKTRQDLEAKMADTEALRKDLEKAKIEKEQLEQAIKQMKENEAKQRNQKSFTLEKQQSLEIRKELLKKFQQDDICIREDTVEKLEKNVTDYYIIAVAINLSTSVMKYAFSFRTNPKSALMNKSFSDDERTPFIGKLSCILIHKGGESELGKAALIKWQNASLKEKENMLCFDLFSFLSHSEQDLSIDTMISTIDGKDAMKASDVFASMLEYIKSHFIDHISQHIYSIDNVSMIKWVMIIPENISNDGRECFKKAAFQAGLIKNMEKLNNQVMFITPCLAAAVRTSDLDDRPNDYSFAVINLQGNVLECAAYRSLPTGNLMKGMKAITYMSWEKDLFAAFESLFSKVFLAGAEKSKMFRISFSLFKSETKIYAWELLKEKIKANLASKFDKLVFQLPQNFAQVYANITNEKLECNVKNADKRYGMEWKNGYLQISKEGTNKLLSSLTNDIVQTVKEALYDPIVESCSQVYFVGEFAGYHFVQEAMNQNFGEKTNLVFANEPNMDALIGAVQYGHKPKAVYEIF